MGILFVTTDPAPIVTFFPITTSSIIQTLGPIYVKSPIIAALLWLEPIVVNWDRLTLFPIIAVGLTTIGPACPMYNPNPIFVLLYYNEYQSFFLFGLTST